MTAAKTKLTEANTKITEMTTEADKLATLLDTEITEANQAQLFQDVKTAQDKIRTLARTTHALLVDTIKEINGVL
jgi:F0F1-type ATP synthase membrane subunit b/b'